MKHSLTNRRSGIPAAQAIAVALAVGAAAFAQSADKSALWQNNPFDRITLIDDKHYDIDPVRIPPGRMKEIQTEPNEVVSDAEGKQIHGLPPIREMNRQLLYRIRMLDDGSEYYVKGSSIKSIAYFEDMLLAEARKLIGQKRFDEAHPYLAAARDKSPEWPTLFETQVKFHRDEGLQLSQQLDFARALAAFLEEKRIREEGAAAGKKMPAEDEVGYLSVDQRIEDLAERWFRRSLERADYEEGRKIVARFEALLPNSGIAGRCRERFASMAKVELAESARLAGEGRMDESYRRLRSAVEMAPDLEEVRKDWRAFFEKHPVLRVGVERLSTYATGVTGWSSADWRCSELLHLPLMRLKPGGDGDAFESRVLEPLESSGTNKEVTIRVRPGLVWPGDMKPVTAIDVQRLLVDSCQPASPFYHPAFARLVLGIEAVNAGSLQVRFDRPQFRPAIWLQLPFVRLEALESASDGGTLSRSGLGPYRYVGRTSNESVFEANARFIEGGKPVVREVIETSISSSAERLRALETSRIDVSAYVPPRHLERAAKIPGVRVVRQALPRVHLLQFNMSRVEFRNRTLRRAIAYAIDRKGILEGQGVKLDKDNCLTSGPLPVGSFGYNAAVELRPYDPSLARVLLHGVRRQFASMPTFRMSVSGNETERAAAAEIVKSLEKIGLKLTVIDYEGTISADPLDGDIRYMSYTVTDPIYDLASLLTRENPSLAVNASTWLRDKAVQLMQVPNQSAAAAILPEIHRILHDDVALVPLWQLYDHFAVSESVGGMPEVSASVYSSIENWTVKPRFPPAHWSQAAGQAQRNGPANLIAGGVVESAALGGVKR